jgi:ligand-binding SRPBCC domain-containing protein
VDKYCPATFTTEKPVTQTLTQAPANARVFEKRTVMNTTLDRMRAFHEDPKALGRLTPPPIFMQLIRDDRTSLTEGEIEFNLWFVVVPIRWLARHAPGVNPESFTDYMVKGPMAYWHHEHTFEEVPGGVALTDRLTVAHKPGLPGLLTRLMFDGIPLRILFFYRHLRTRLAVQR